MTAKVFSHEASVKRGSAAKCVALALSAALAVTGVVGLAGCSTDNSGANITDSASKTVAATIGSTTVYEEDVTAYIEQMRSDSGYTDDSTWAFVLSIYGYTPESFREAIIKDFAYAEALSAAAAKEGVTVSDEEIDEAIAAVKDNAGLSDDLWDLTLANSGYTTESYRESIEQSLLEIALYDKLTADATIDDDYFAEYGMEYVLNYFSDIKRSSHILFETEDLETAEAVLAQLKAGEITFEDAVEQYSIDTVSAAAGGDVGWSGVHTFVDEYQEGLDQLEVGQMSDLVQSDYGYHIILCTDAFKATATTAVEEVPEDLYDYICSYYLQDSVANTVYLAYLDDMYEELGLDVVPMPEGLSYDVDINALLGLDSLLSGSDSSSDEGMESTDSTESTTSGSSGIVSATTN